MTFHGSKGENKISSEDFFFFNGFCRETDNEAPFCLRVATATGGMRGWMESVTLEDREGTAAAASGAPGTERIRLG